jgi:hypothetical protein
MRAYGTRVLYSAHPPLKWRATVGGPSGTARDLPLQLLVWGAADVDSTALCGGTREILRSLKAAQDDVRKVDLSGLSHYPILFGLKADVRGPTSRT